MENETPGEEQFEQVEQMQEAEQPKKRGGAFRIISLLSLIVIIVLGAFGAYNFINKDANSSYSAVFLDNNQVYFGKMSGGMFGKLVIEDVYYLRVTQVLQNTADGQQIQVPDINLIKLGTELHKPSDRMEIQTDHVLFTQRLTAESDVIKAIESYQVSQEQ